jgi:hypothetical protein
MNFSMPSTTTVMFSKPGTDPDKAAGLALFPRAECHGPLTGHLLTRHR